MLTGCGHAGIVNIVRYARRLTGIDTVAAVVGGFHLSGPAFEPIIKPTVDALVGIGAEAIIPAHCTGWRAAHALAQAMPEAYIPNRGYTRSREVHELWSKVVGAYGWTLDQTRTFVGDAADAYCPEVAF